MTMQIERDDGHQKHRRTAGLGITLFAPSKYVKSLPAHPVQNGIGDHACGVATHDDAPLHVKLLAIRRTHRLQSPM
jgi:hypothetical protein